MNSTARLRLVGWMDRWMNCTHMYSTHTHICMRKTVRSFVFCLFHVHAQLCSFIHSLTHSYSFTHFLSFVHSFVRSYVRSFACAFVVAIVAAALVVVVVVILFYSFQFVSFSTSFRCAAARLYFI